MGSAELGCGFNAPASVAKHPPAREREKKMDAEVTAVLQAYGAAIAALFATHSDRDQLRAAFETIASADENPHPMFHRTMETLRGALAGS
jgi:hypothetical protein